MGHMSTRRRARIVLADDHAAALVQASRVLGERWEIVGTAGNGVELLEVAARLEPDVIVSDIAMPLMDGFEAARRLRHAGSRSRLVFLTVWEDPDYLEEATRLGADAYVVKSRLACDLVPAVERALARRD
jgi:DNA-binding NarL/FixJ family response regulator